MNSLSDYDYDLPEDRIAQVPAEDRSASRLLVWNRKNATIEHKRFYDIINDLDARDALVINNTKVIPARVHARRQTGGEVEIFLLEQVAENRWKALARPTARLKEGETLALHAGGEALLVAYENDGIWQVELRSELTSEVELDRIGRMPLPHYIKREKREDPRDGLDLQRYQTVYGEHQGAVAAPTAGLHFTEELLAMVQDKGVTLVTVTLHVGVGTFAPVREDDFTRHRMHEERYTLSAESAATLNRIRAAGGRIVSVGTTSTRVLETMADEEGRLREGAGRTGIFIYPPYRFKAVDALVTNFHLPRSTLLLLVSAFAGRESVLRAYAEAIEREYRFYSYGDAMLIL